MSSILFIGDIFGSLGREALKEQLPRLKKKYNPTFIIVNAENAAGGRGLTHVIAKEFFEWGAHALTMGNHTWDQKGIYEFIDQEPRLIRPINYPPGTPGHGWTVIRQNNIDLTVVNAMGRTFLPALDCPFRTVDTMLKENPSNLTFVDFHAEATSEKIAMGWYLNGRVSAIVGTHTHVQTNDERILSEGTAYMSDVGMTGPRDGVLGMDREPVLQKFITQLPVRFTPAIGKWHLHGVFIKIDTVSGKSTHIEKIKINQDDVLFD